MIRSWALVLFSSPLLLAAVERDAAACSAPPPGLAGTIPASGATHPANAPVVLSGYGLDLSKITAKVDGSDATTGKVDPPAGGFGLRVSPEPKAGQKVVLTGQVCSAAAGCELNLEYTVAEADTTAPGAVDEISFDVFDYDDYIPNLGSCFGPKYFSIYTTISAQPSAAVAPEFWNVALLDAATKTKVYSGQFQRSGQGVQVTLEIPTQGLDAGLPSGFCIEAESIDLASNKTAIKSQCRPCRYRKEAVKPKEFSSLPAPQWTDADVVPGGSCDKGGGGGGGATTGPGGGGSGGATTGPGGAAGSASPGAPSAQTEEDSGCSVGRGASPGGALALGLLGLLGLSRRARRRRR